MDGKIIKVSIWRRGRGIVHWNFVYVTDSNKPWFSSPGWYHAAKKRIYRLTIDHDYPGKPVWLGFRRNGAWNNAEGLYEVLLITHPDYVIATKNYRGSRGRSIQRREKTEFFLAAKARWLIKWGKYGWKI